MKRATLSWMSLMPFMNVLLGSFNVRFGLFAEGLLQLYDLRLLW